MVTVVTIQLDPLLQSRLECHEDIDLFVHHQKPLKFNVVGCLSLEIRCAEIIGRFFDDPACLLLFAAESV